MLDYYETNTRLISHIVCECVALVHFPPAYYYICNKNPAAGPPKTSAYMLHQKHKHTEML